MRRGTGSKAKGTSFERTTCAQLSMWVSGNASSDWLWRSSMSGGRATVAKRKGRDIKPLGDICAIDPQGHVLTDDFFIECKHYKRLEIDRFMLGTGKLVGFWRHAVAQAAVHKRLPMLIAKQNNFPTLLLVPSWTFDAPCMATMVDGTGFVDFHDFAALVQTPWRVPPSAPSRQPKRVLRAVSAGEWRGGK